MSDPDRATQLAEREMLMDERIDRQAENVRAHMQAHERFQDALRDITDGYRNPLPSRFTVDISTLRGPAASEAGRAASKALNESLNGGTHAS